MSNYVLGVVLEARDRMTATVQRGLTGLRNLRTGCSSASTGLSGVQASAERVGRSTEQLGRSASNASRGISSLTGGLGGMLGGLVGVGAAVSGINMFKQFDDTMLAVKAKTKATGEEFTSLREKAKELGASTRFSASEAAKGMDYLAMAGYKTNEIIDAMPGLLNLAAASGEGLASVSDIVSDVMTAFGWAAKDTEKFADIMAYAASNSNTSVGMMGESFKYVASVASSAGVSAQETATALALMANAGVKGSMGGTALRSSLIRLIKPPKEAADAMEFLGVQAVDNTGNFVGLRSIVAQMTEKTQGMTKAQKASAAAAIFGTEAVSGMMGMINQGPEAFDKFLAGVENSKGASSDMAAVMNSGIGGAIDNMTSALENVVICAGDKFAPTIAQAAIHVADFAMEISKVDFNAVAAGVIGLTSAFAVFSVASSIKIAGGFVAWLAPAATTFTALSLPILASAAAVGSLVAAGVWLYQNWDTLEERSGVWGIIGGDIKYIVGVIGNEISYVVGLIDNEIRYIVGIVSNEFAYLSGVVSNEFLYIRSVVVNEVKNISDLFATFKEVLQENKGVIKGTATVLGVIFAPALVNTGVQAVIAGTKIAIQFVGSIINAGVQAVITGGSIGVVFVKSIIATGVQAVIAGKQIVVSLIGSMAAYATQGWTTVAVIGAQIAAWAWNGVTMLTTATAQGVMTIATGIWTSVCAVASGVTWSLGAAFAFLTSPIGLVVLAIGGLVATGIWMYNNWDDIKAGLVLLWNDPLAALKQFGTSAENSLKKLFDWLGEKWAWVKGLFSSPIEANIKTGTSNIGSIPQNATGTNFFLGGLTSINERGGEILDLPRGTRIYPAATTQKIIKQEVGSGAISGSKFIAQISGNYFTVREEVDINKIAEALVQRLERASLNSAKIY